MLVSFIFMKLCLCNGYIKLQRLMIYPNYTDTKLFLNILILLMTQQEWQCIPNHYSMWKQRRNKRSLCESGAVEGWEDVCIWWSDSCKACTLGVHSGSQWNHGQSCTNDTFLKFSPFRQWGYVQGVQHVTIGIIPSFGTDPACKTLNRFQFLYIFIERWGSQSALAYSRLGQMNATYSRFRVSISEYL